MPSIVPTCAADQKRQKGQYWRYKYYKLAADIEIVNLDHIYDAAGLCSLLWMFDPKLSKS